MRALLSCLLLAGCASAAPEPVVRTVEIRVPVPVPCVIDLPDPVYSDTAEALRNAPDIFERVKLLLAGRVERQAQDDAERAARRACGGQ